MCPGNHDAQCLTDDHSHTTQRNFNPKLMVYGLILITGLKQHGTQTELVSI